MDIALGTGAFGELIFEGGIAAGDAFDSRECLARKWRPPEISMQQHAGCVNHRPERRLGLLFQLGFERGDKRVIGGDFSQVGQFLAQVVLQSADDGNSPGMPKTPQKLLGAWVLKNLIYRGNIARGNHH